MIEHDDARALFLDGMPDLIDLAAAGEETRTGQCASSGDRRRDLQARRRCQLPELFQFLVETRITEVDMDEDRPCAVGSRLRQIRLRFAGLRVSTLVVRARQLDRACRHDGRDGMFVDELADRISEQQHELIEGFNLSLQLDAVDQVDGNRYPLLA
jgi:hypothetical protein